MLRDPKLEASPPAVWMVLSASARKARVERTQVSCRDDVTSRDTSGTAAQSSGGCAPGCRLEAGGERPHFRRPRCHGSRPGRMTALPGGGEAAGKDLQDLRNAAISCTVAHRIESTSDAAPEPGTEAAGMATGLPAPPLPHLDPKMAMTVRSSSNRTPLVELIVTRGGVRQQHEMTARCGPRTGQCDRQEFLAREMSDGERARGQLLRHFRRRNLAAEHQAYRAAGGALAPAGAAPERPDRGVPRPGGDNRWLACRVNGADTPLRLCAAGVRLRPRREGVEEFGRLGELLPIPEGRDVAVPRRARARPPGRLPEMRHGAAPPGLAVPTRLACPARCCWSASPGGAAQPGAESRLRATPSRPAGRRTRA